MAKAGLIYNIDLTPNSGSITGTIETDGTIGTLQLANILNYSLTLNDSVDSYIINSINSTLNVNGSSQLFSTATELLFNFEGTTSNWRWDASPLGEHWMFALQAQTGNGYVFLNHNFRIDEHSQTENGYTGIQVVAMTNIPEPSTLAIFALGMIGLASRRFKKQS